MQQTISFRECPGPDQRPGVAYEIAVRQNDALGHTRRARRVEQRGHVILGAMHEQRSGRDTARLVDQRTVAVTVKRQQVSDARRVRERRNGIGIATIANNDRRFGIAEKILQFCGLVSRVQWVKHEAATQAGQVE